jgi:hypothetical protein
MLSNGIEQYSQIYDVPLRLLRTSVNYSYLTFNQSIENDDMPSEWLV